MFETLILFFFFFFKKKKRNRNVNVVVLLASYWSPSSKDETLSGPSAKGNDEDEDNDLTLSCFLWAQSSASFPCNKSTAKNPKKGGEDSFDCLPASPHYIMIPYFLLPTKKTIRSA